VLPGDQEVFIEGDQETRRIFLKYLAPDLLNSCSSLLISCVSTVLPGDQEVFNRHHETRRRFLKYLAPDLLIS
jgi:hypothetical protein